MFNDYDWSNYKKAGGSQTIQVFDDFLQGRNMEKAAEKLTQLHGLYCPDRRITESYGESLREAAKYLSDEMENTDEEKYRPQTREQVDEALNTQAEELWHCYHSDNGEKLDDKEAFNWFSEDLPCISLKLAFYDRDCFIPFGYQYLYNVMSEICAEFKIDLPELPSKTDYRGRFMHYAELCRTFQTFRADHGMTIGELWAFIYEYADGVIGYKQWISPLSGQPRNAFLVGGSAKGDGDDNDAVFLSAEAESRQGSAFRWQSSPDAERNDINIVYLRQPVSSVSYILQAVSEGFIDPFFRYYRCIYLSNPIKVPALSIREMRADPKISAIPIVRKNMYGVNGVKLKACEYQTIIEKLSEKGLDKNTVPQLREYAPLAAGELLVEKDVEEQLVNPLLEQLGYSKEEYERQMRVRMGRGEKVIPDYVVHPTHEAGKETCDFLIETKLTIPTAKQLQIDLGQARSYARRLNAKKLLLASSEGIWIAFAGDDFTATAAYSWFELRGKDIINSVYDSFGNRK